MSIAFNGLGDARFSRHAAVLYAKDAVMFARRRNCKMARHHLEDAREALRDMGKTAAPRVRGKVAEASRAVARACRR